MAKDFVRMRDLPPPTKSFGEGAKRAAAAANRGGGNFKRVEGLYSDFYPRKEKAIWIAICRNQAWDSEMYDSEAGAVLKFEKENFFAYNGHRVASNKRRFVCSAGVNRDKPCWGCGIRSKFYDEKSEREEVLGERIKAEAPISFDKNMYAIAIVEMEMMGKQYVLGDDGQPRKKKDGSPITRDKALKLCTDAEKVKLKADGMTAFGCSRHYSLRLTHWNSLIAFDEELRNRCANCAGHLHADVLVCPDCMEEHAWRPDDEDVDTLSGEVLSRSRKVDIQCDCGHYGKMIPKIICDQCGHPEDGKLLDFAICLYSEKVGEKQTVLKMSDVRPLSYYINKYPAVVDLLNKPLEIDKIFAPDSLEEQKGRIPAKMRGDGVSPLPRVRKGDSSADHAVPFPLGAKSQPEQDDSSSDDD